MYGIDKVSENEIEERKTCICAQQFVCAPEEDIFGPIYVHERWLDKES